MLCKSILPVNQVNETFLITRKLARAQVTVVVVDTN